MIVIDSVPQIIKEVKAAKDNGQKISFIPTMGALHDGHLSLIKEAKKVSNIVVVSIFVNQAQFNNAKDYENYPVTINEDLERLKGLEVDYVFYPKGEEILSDEHAVNGFLDQNLAKNLCGKGRDGHFEAVVMIVSRFFKIIQPDIAVFGQKDFQQLRIIEEMTKNLNQNLGLNIKILSAEIVRQESGLAMSSRNLRLSNQDQERAANIFRILSKVKAQFLEQNKSISKILQSGKDDLLQSGFEEVEYFEIRREDNLELVTDSNLGMPSRIFIAVYLQKVRLIDNLAV